MLFDPADLDQLSPPRLGAPVKGDNSEDAWVRAAEACAREIGALPTPRRRQFIARLGREMELVVDELARGSDEGDDIADRIRRLRTTRTNPEASLAFNMQLVKAHVMRDLLGLGHAALARELEVSTSTLYRLLSAWRHMLATGELPIQRSGDEPGPASRVAVDPVVLEEITKLPAKSQGSAFLRAARRVDPAAVRSSGRRSPTLSSGEVAYMKFKEQTVAPQIMDSAFDTSYRDDIHFDDRDDSDDDDWNDEDMEADENAYQAEAALALALDRDDAGLEEYDSLRSGRPWATNTLDPCVCARHVELCGSAADVYIKEHLIITGRDEREVGLYVCPDSGRRWHQDWPNAGRSSWGDTRLRQLR